MVVVINIVIVLVVGKILVESFPHLKHKQETAILRNAPHVVKIGQNGVSVLSLATVVKKNVLDCVIQ